MTIKNTVDKYLSRLLASGGKNFLDPIFGVEVPGTLG
jgi:hypothetical protein